MNSSCYSYISLKTLPGSSTSVESHGKPSGMDARTPPLQVALHRVLVHDWEWLMYTIYSLCIHVCPFIDGLPFLKMGGSFNGYVKNNQRVYDCRCIFGGGGWFVTLF